MSAPSKVHPEKAIDTLLEFLDGFWRHDLPEYAASWDALDPGVRLTFVVDWPSWEGEAEELHEFVTAGDLTREQQWRYDALLAVMAANRPLLDRLLAEPDPATPTPVA